MKALALVPIVESQNGVYNITGSRAVAIPDIEEIRLYPGEDRGGSCYVVLKSHREFWTTHDAGEPLMKAWGEYLESVQDS